MAFGIDRPTPHDPHAAASSARRRAPQAAFARLAFALALACGLCLPAVGAMAPSAAYADDSADVASSTQVASDAASDAQQAAAVSADEATSPCVPTADQLAAWEADGTLEARQAYAAQFEHSQPDASLVAQASAREAAASGASDAADLQATLPEIWQSGMASTGKARVLALRVSFPAGDGEAAMTFPEEDSLEALQALIDGEGGAYPYEDLSSYYERSSYGKLSITGKAYDYQAKYPRSHYETNVNDLFYEALAALEDELDYADFDGNGDGVIDGVYIHAAGGNDGWGSPWWSYTRTDMSGLTFDGLGICRLVTLANASNDASASRTLIHETGHVLGLPDYYSYRALEGGLSGRTGILTFDMMMDNVGDHNGFSKWLLGWLDDDDVTRVVATSDGVTATRGGDVVASASASDVLKGVELTLAPFTSEQLEETGGIIVVSNADEGIFSSYYVLQYDRFAGNQSVYYQDGATSHQLPNGWRMYRVQAELTEGNLDFAHTNTYGAPTDQLIELVDPDMDAEHISNDGFAPVAAGREYACMLFEGDEVTPDTYPSTNFFENEGLGYTGISAKATSCGDAAGTVRISHSGEDAPELPEFGLTLRDGQFAYNVGTLVFDATSAPYVGGEQALMADTRLVVDGVAHPTSVSVDGTTVTVSCYFDADEITPDSTCEIIFPAKQFVVSQTVEGTVYSPEIRMTIDVGDVARVESTGSYGEKTITYLGKQTSNAITLADGSLAFFQLANTGVVLDRVTADGTALSQVELSGADLLHIYASSTLSATDLGDGSVLLAVRNTDDGSMELRVVDVETGAVTAKGRLENAWIPSVSAMGDGTFAVLNPVPQSDRYYAALFTPQADGTLSQRYLSFDADGAIAAGDGFVALLEANYTGTDLGTTISLVRTEDLAELVRESGSDAFEDVYAGEGGTGSAGYAPSVPAAATLACEGYLNVADVAASEAGFAVITTLKANEDASDLTEITTQENTVLSFSPEGTLLFAQRIDSSQAGQKWLLPFSEISLNDEGGIAVTRRSERFPGLFVGNETVLISAHDAAGSDASPAVEASRLITFSTGEGTWLSDGSWIAVGWHIDPYPDIAGSPDAATSASGGGSVAIENQNDLVYHITGPVSSTVGGSDDPDTPDTPTDPDDPDQPDDPDTPEDPSDPDDPEEPNTPTDPDDPTDPEDPSDPDTPGSSDDPSDPGTSSGSDKPAANNPGTTLAATGDNAVVPAAAAVVAVCSLVAVFAAAHRTRAQHDSQSEETFDKPVS